MTVRKLVDHHHRAGHGVVGQRGGQHRAQRHRVRAGTGRPGVREQFAVAHDGADARNAGLGGQHGFDLGQLDPVAAHLDLPVEPAEADKFPAGQQPAQVTGAVRPQPVGVDAEPVAVLVEVAGGEVAAADHDLAGVRGEVQPVAGERNTDRQRPAGVGSTSDSGCTCRAANVISVAP
ncbi:hypothetical protein V2I01_40825 [Micromonospora sp. BRA006-A]|nr:hypothetical protein [Micromonospora sp. BRA006-A]